jgi:uncharacterized membrane protein
MNDAEIHLAINHLPVAATIFGVLILLIGMIAKSDGASNTGLLLLVAGALLILPTFHTGEEAEEIVENLALGEETHDYIHEHEEEAESARWLSFGVGFLALIAFYFKRQKRSPAKLFSFLALLGGFGSMVYLGLVANSGGQIRHTEAREGFEVPAHDEPEQENEEYDND